MAQLNVQWIAPEKVDEPRELESRFYDPTAACRKCGHRKDSHAVTPDGYACSRCKCKRRFWR